MEHKLYTENDMRVSNWTGGKTKQLAIYPADGNYLERNFIWRLSSATCEMEESDFSKLPDFNRVLMVLEGDVVLAHQDERVARLKQYEQDRFDGAFKTKSFGKITDYNLMTAKGNEGFLTYVPLQSQVEKLNLTKTEDFQKASFGFYVTEGYAVVSIGKESVMVSKGQQLVVDGEFTEKYDFGVMGEGSLVFAEVYYNETGDDFGPTIIPTKPVSFDDWKCCLYLSNSQFRGARFFFKRKKEEWIDEELSHVVNNIEKACATMLVYVVGLIIMLLLAVQANMSDGAMLLIALLWIVVESIVVSPLIYLIFVPKPVRPHIKKISELTPYEQKVREEQIEGLNPRIQRILDNSVTGNQNFTGVKGPFSGRKK